MATYTIKAGDTFTTIASQLNTTVAALISANPTVKPESLQIGQIIDLPSTNTTPAPISQNYTIKAGDTFSAIAQRLNIDVAKIESLNPFVDPMKLAVGQVIKIPATAGGSVPPTAPNPQPVPAPQPTTGKYTIVGGDTFTSIASRYGTDVATIEKLNPGVSPTALQIGQVINVPTHTAHPPLPHPTNPHPGTGPANPTPVGGAFVSYSGPASSFPSPALWSTFDALWTFNSNLMKFSNSAAEISIIGSAISQVARESGMDSRVILCMCMQETGGNVRAPVTTSPAPDFVRNTGIMQAHDGAVYDPADPRGSITQMIRDGAAGTAKGDGLKQCYARYGNYYAALRAYNSGSVDLSNLSNGITATPDYVSKIANRLLGHVWQNM